MLILVSLLLAAPAHHAPAARLPRGTIVTPSGIRIQTLKASAGPMPGPNDAVLIDYVGRLKTGKIFDQAKGAGMMVSQTVPGFAEALQQMHKGGTYRIWIPPQLGYGERGAGEDIPPNSTLDFTVTLIDIGRPAPQP